MATQTELYRFTEQGSADVWTYTSGDQVVTYDAGEGDEDYAPVSISRSEVESRNELSRANLDIQVPLTNPAALRWLADNGELLVGLTVFEQDRLGAVSVIWKGRLTGVIPGMDSITLKFESIFTSLRRPGLRARYQKSCRHALYGRGCNLDPEDFATVGACTGIVGSVVTVTEADAQPDGYYTGGMLRSPDGVLSYIINHTGSALTLQRISFSLLQAAAIAFPFDVTIYPGCSHDRNTCNAKFDNLLNYGGFDFIPTKNPMGGSSIV